jgi:hypothetical protein
LQLQAYLRWGQAVAVVAAVLLLHQVVREEMEVFLQVAVAVAAQRRMEPHQAQVEMAQQASQLSQHIFNMQTYAILN